MYFNLHRLGIGLSGDELTVDHWLILYIDLKMNGVGTIRDIPLFSQLFNLIPFNIMAVAGT